MGPCITTHVFTLSIHEAGARAYLSGLGKSDLHSSARTIQQDYLKNKYNERKKINSRWLRKSIMWEVDVLATLSS